MGIQMFKKAERFGHDADALFQADIVIGYGLTEDFD